MLKEAPKDLSTTDGLKELKKTLRAEFQTHPCFMGLGVGAGFHGEPLDALYLRIYLERIPQDDEELNDLINLIRRVPQEVPTSIKVEPEITRRHHAANNPTQL